MEEQPHLFDICIICALYEEASAVIHEFAARCHVPFTTVHYGLDRYEYQSTTIKNTIGEPLTVLVTWLPEMGPTAMAQELKLLVQQFHPRFVAMTGICAGDQRQVQLGDLVIASAAYHYEEGKIIRGSQGQVHHQPTIRTACPSDQVLQYARGFQGWQKSVAAMKRRLLKRSLQTVGRPKQIVAPMASGMAVRADEPFSWLQERYHYKTVALDMEAASFYQALRNFTHALVVKGVCDYADLTKNDAYRDYAARVSAVYMLHFIQEYVTEQKMPRREGSNQTEPPSVWTVPYQRHPFFTGQEQVLTTLAETLQRQQTVALTQPQAITGLGGIGKTQIAVEYAWQHRQEYQAVLWSRADTHEALLSGYVVLARSLGVPEKEEKDQTIIVKALLRWFSTHTGWLLILDNADDLGTLESFLPSERRGHVLITTRAQATGTLAHHLDVEMMSPEVGATLLLRRAHLIAPDASLDTALSLDTTIALTISEELGGLPLALDQAGAYIEETQCGLAGYQELYRSHPSPLLKRRGSSTSDYPASVSTTWFLSFAKVEQQNPMAAELLRCCAFLHPDAIPVELFTQGAAHLGNGLRQMRRDPLAFDEAVRVLCSYSLIRRDSTTAMLAIHRLMQAVLLDILPAKVRKQWQARVMRALAAVFPERVRDELARCERLWPQALICVSWIKNKQKSTREVASLLDRTGTYLRERAQYGEAELLLEQALAIHQQQLGSQHLDTTRSLNNLAILYWLQGKHGEAEPLFQQALAIRQQQLGSQHLDTAQSLNNLANLYGDQRKYAEAEPLYQRALAIRQQQLGLQHLDTAQSLDNLAILYGDQGKYAEAEPLYQQALAIRQQQLGSQHLDTAQSLNNLAELYRLQGKYAEAEPLYQRALHIFELRSGPEHPYVAYPLHGLAILFRDQGNDEQAASLFLRALAIREGTLATTHPVLAETLHEFAILRQAQGRDDEARSLYERALATWSQVLGPANPQTIDTRKRLVALLHSMGRTEEAAQFDLVQPGSTQEEREGQKKQ